MLFMSYVIRVRVIYPNGERDAEFFAEKCFDWLNDGVGKKDYSVYENIISWNIEPDSIYYFCRELGEKYPNEHFRVEGIMDLSEKSGEYKDFIITYNGGKPEMKLSGWYVVWWLSEINDCGGSVKMFCEKHGYDATDELREKYIRYLICDLIDKSESLDAFLEENCENIAEDVDFIRSRYESLSTEREKFFDLHPETRERIEEYKDSKADEIRESLLSEYPETKDLFFVKDSVFYVNSFEFIPYFERALDSGFSFEIPLFRYGDFL